jgi:cyclopropane fatty-acyl-phospholipid synthase-like methyltransferase
MVLIDDTLAFVRRWLPPPPLRLLEIGAGAGELTEPLLALGYTITALDSDPNAVAEAHVRGLPVRLATWPAVMPMCFDAAVFVRTLHHLGNLDKALSAVRAILPHNGLVLVDDFAFADLPAKTTAWLRPWVTEARAARLLCSTPHPIVRHLLSNGSRKPFREDHEVHTAEAMDRALRDHFSVVEATVAPYLYRYLSASVKGGPKAAALVRAALAAERTGIEQGSLWALGRRWVAKVSV